MLNHKTIKIMKKNLFYSLMALFVVLFVSCGQEEIVSDNGTEINAPKIQGL